MKKIFLEYVDESFDTEDDNILTADEIATVTEVVISYDKVADLTGIEYFYNLRMLECQGNEIEKIDISRNKALQRLYISNNKLTELDLSKCPRIVEVAFHCNHITCLKFEDKHNMFFVNSNENTREIILTGSKFELSSLSESFDPASVEKWTNAEVEGNIATVIDPEKPVIYEYTFARNKSGAPLRGEITLIPIANNPVEREIEIQTVPKSKKIRYNGYEQELLRDGYVQNGTLMYSLYEDGEYSPEVPRATAPGIYEVWYYAKSDSIYFSDSERKCVESFIVLESDINMDGKFNSRDAVALKSYLLLGRTSRLDMAEADVNKDGGINVVDYRMVMRMLITMRGI